MKRSIRIIAMILTLSIAFSCVGAGAFAESSIPVAELGKRDPVTGYGGLIVFGDSISRGCESTAEGLPDYYKEMSKRNVDGSFSKLLAEAIGCDMPEDMKNEDGTLVDATYWPASYPGHTLHGMMRWLGWETEPWDAVTEASEADIYNRYFTPAYNDPSDLLDFIRRANVIVVEEGMSDTFFRGMITTLYGTTDASDVGQLAMDAITNLYEGYEHWKDQYPEFIKRLRQENDHAIIIMLGSFNLATNLTISDELLLPIGDVLTVLSASMNNDYRKWEKAFNDPNIRYVDISNVETPISEFNYSVAAAITNDFNAAVHPTRGGYQYIYRQILAALPEEEIAEPICPIFRKKDTNIVFDMGRFTNVSYVMVDNKRIKDWSFGDAAKGENPYEITIPYLWSNAKLLTVVAVKDGKVATYFYQLTYDKDHYEVDRIYNMGDTVKTATTVVKNVIGVGSKLLTAFAGLFKK